MQTDLDQIIYHRARSKAIGELTAQIDSRTEEIIEGLVSRITEILDAEEINEKPSAPAPATAIFPAPVIEFGGSNGSEPVEASDEPSIDPGYVAGAIDYCSASDRTLVYLGYSET